MFMMWYRRTELEKGLIIMLIILVPMIILLSGLYAYLAQWRRTVKQPFILRSVDTANGDTTRYVPKRSISFCDCSENPKNCNNTFEPHKFISSISETIFDDDPNSLNFKCSAVLITESYFLTFSDCLSKNATFQIRSSSKYWSKYGYIRHIYNFVNVDNYFIIAKLSNPLPYDGISIKIAELSKAEVYESIQQFDAYRWTSKFNYGLKRMKKYSKLQKITLNITKCIINTNFKGFCAIEPRKCSSNEDLDDRDSVFEVNSNKLIGIEIGRYIWDDFIEHYYLFIGNMYVQKYKTD